MLGHPSRESEGYIRIKEIKSSGLDKYKYSV